MNDFSSPSLLASFRSVIKSNYEAFSSFGGNLGKVFTFRFSFRVVRNYSRGDSLILSSRVPFLSIVNLTRSFVIGFSNFPFFIFCRDEKEGTD